MSEPLADDSWLSPDHIRAATPDVESVDFRLYEVLWHEARKERDIAEVIISRLERAVRSIRFFASVIKSGESWTEECERAYQDALPTADEVRGIPSDDQKGDSNDVGDARPEWTGNADHKGDCVFCSECGICTVGGVTSRCWVTKDGRHITGRDGT